MRIADLADFPDISRAILPLALASLLFAWPLTSGKAAPAADWRASQKQALSFVAAQRPSDAALKLIQAMQGLRTADVTDADPDAQKLILTSLPAVMKSQMAVDDWNGVETVGKWAVSVSESRFGNTSPLTYMSYQALSGYVYGQMLNRVTPNREARGREVHAKMAQIKAAQSPAQLQATKKYEDASIARAMAEGDAALAKMQVNAQKAKAASESLEKSLGELKRWSQSVQSGQKK